MAKPWPPTPHCFPSTFKLQENPKLLHWRQGDALEAKKKRKGWSNRIEKMAAEWGFSAGDVLLRAGLFLMVQALVYFILKKSSSVFKRTVSRSSSFRTVRSVSIRRMMALVSDLPEGEPSPTRSSSSSRLATQPSM